MTNNQIRYMIEVAHTGSVNQASRNLFISQSALSNAILSVEEEFNRKIFHRSSRGVTLTPFGKLFIAYIIPINHQLNQLYTMRGVRDGVEVPTLTVISNGFFYINGIMATIGKRHQSTGVRLSVMEDYGGNMLDAITSQAADLGVIRLWSCYKENNVEQYSAMKLLYNPICQLRLGIDVSKNSQLYYFEGKEITPQQLADYPQIVHESLDCGPYADILFRLKIPASRTRYVVDSRASMYELLDTTDGYVLNSRKINEEATTTYNFHNHDWRFIPLENCPIYSEIGWIIKESTVLNQVTKEFIHLLKDYLLRDISQEY